MIKRTAPETYADALFEAKRGFIIIGLTGYTGSGCTTTANFLSRPSKPSLPSKYKEHLHRNDVFSDKYYNQLHQIWEQYTWIPFTVIEVAAVIMAIMLRQTIESGADSLPRAVKEHFTSADKRALSGLDHLLEEESLSTKQAEKLVTAYQESARILRLIKSDMNIADFINMMQDAGDKVRLFGKYTDGLPDPKNMLVMPEAIRKIISAYKKKYGTRRFVIDAFRNPYEVEYFKRRYAEFYLICVARPPGDRASDLRKKMSLTEINRVWEKEQGKLPTGGKNKEECPPERKNIAWWVTSQNIPGCAQKADIYISGTKLHGHLAYHLARLLVLIHKPGCLPPSEDEHRMQIAATARHMSGCLSRQVGAVLAHPSGYIVGIGWNNPPEGQAPCSLRSCKELLELEDTEDASYSQYERSSEFRSHIDAGSRGVVPFCFRSELEKMDPRKRKRMEYTRALHAEENAFLQAAKVGGGSVQGCTLYTTASTCTLCAKKAYHLDVIRIVYIEEYPDMAYTQTIKTGIKKIAFEQFEGISGSAFFSLFAPLMPEKDLVEYY